MDYLLKNGVTDFNCRTVDGKGVIEMKERDRESVLKRLQELHIKLHYRQSYDYNSVEDLTQRINDLNEVDSLKACVRSNGDWDTAELSKELSERIRKATSLNY